MAELRRMGVRLTAEGVSQYRDDLRSAGREARLMSQETRLAMAELGSGASSANKFQTQLKGLERQYSVQENKLKTLTNSQKDYTTSLDLNEREMKQVSKALSDSQRETQRLEKNYRQMGEALGWNADETKKAKAEWKASQDETKELATSLNELEKESNQYSKELEKIPGQMNSAKISMAEMSNEMQRLQQEYIKNGGELAGVADTVGKVSDRVRTFSDGLVDVGSTMTTHFTVPIVAGVAATVKAASDWESAFAGVQKTNDEVVDANGNVVYSYEELEGELRNLTSQLPATHAEIAGVAEAAGQLGIETRNVTSFTKTMIDMGESTNMSAEQAASSLARLANITGMPQAEFDRLGSSIVALGNNFATTEAEITEMSLRLAGIGNQVGMTEADIVALAAAMSSVGIEAQAGGTAMTQVMKRMQNAVADGSEELTMFADVSQMSASEFASAFEEDPARALQAFVEGLEVSSNEGENLNAILGELGITGIREADTLLRLAGNSELLGQALDQSGVAWEENSALAEEAQVRYETLESQLGMLRNEVVDIAIDLGGPFVEALRSGIDAARPFLERVSEMAESFADLDEETQQTIITLLGIGAAAGPALVVFGKFGQAAATAGNGLEWLIRKFGGMKAASDLATPALATTGTSIQGLGTTAATAAGVKGVGGFTAALGTALPWIGGIGLALGAGYGAWKLWGEGAWEASQRTKRWGSDVGEQADKALNEMSESTSVIGQEYNAMSTGVEADTDSMMDSFTALGDTVEKELNERIEKFGTVMDEYSHLLSESTQEMLANEQQGLQESLDTINGYVERAGEIRQQEANSNVEMSAETAKQLADLSKATAEEYIKTLGGTQEEQEQILTALTGDIDNATKEQASIWAQSLGEQRQEMVRHQQDLEAVAEEVIESLELDPNGELANQVRKDFEGINQETINGLDAQLAAIAEKYPEIADEIVFANGQVATESMKMGDAIAQGNQAIIDNGRNMTNALRENALETAESISWMAEEGQKGADTWNNLVYEAKQGDFETDLPELVNEAAQDTQTWNNLRFQLHDANLNSNAKSIIGEAAITNGWWDGMSWEEKEIVLQDEFTISIYEALERSGQWNEMSLEEKTAIMYSNTPEKMTETLAYLGLWDQFEVETKNIDADNYGFINSIRESEEQMNYWQSIPSDTKEILGDNYDLLTTIFQSEQAYNGFKLLSDEEKQFLGNNSDLMEAVFSSEQSYQNWAQLPDDEKQMLANNTDLLLTLLTSEQAYNNWNNLPDEVKQIRANSTVPEVAGQSKQAIDSIPGYKHSNIHTTTNADQTRQSFDLATFSAQTLNNQYPNIPTSTDASNTKGELDSTTGSAQTLDSQSPHVPTSTDAPITGAKFNQASFEADTLDGKNPYVSTNTDAQGNVTAVLNESSFFADILDGKNPYVTADTNSSSVQAEIESAIGSARNTSFSITGVIDWVSNVAGGVARFFNNATGNPSFEGGTTWLGDGGKREPYLTPQGQFGVSGSKDELYNLPRGTRIWPSRQSFKTSARNNDGLKQYLDQIPKFAQGGTIQNPYDGYTGLVGEAGPEIFQIAQGKVSITPISQSQRTQVLNGQNKGVDMSQTNELLQTLIQLVAQGQVIQMDKREVGRTIYDEVDNLLNRNYDRGNIMSMKGGG